MAMVGAVHSVFSSERSLSAESHRQKAYSVDHILVLLLIP
jgi:hypothetical protein